MMRSIVQKLLFFVGLKPVSVPTVRAIFISHGAGQVIQSMRDVEAVQDCGLKGDRYFNEEGYWRSVEACQVTLITEHEVNIAKKGLDLARAQALDAGSHRRNLVISGIKMKTLKGKVFRIGDAIFSYDKPRPPCGYIDKISGRGTCKALSYNSGACLKVVSSGVLQVGDSLELIS